MSMFTKMVRYAEHLGIDSDKLMDMSVAEAILEIEDTKEMWKEIQKIERDNR
jgi:hypothetical protein